MRQYENVPGRSISWPVKVGAVLLVVLAAGGIAIVASTSTEQIACEGSDRPCASDEPGAVERAASEFDQSTVVTRPQSTQTETLPSDHGDSPPATSFLGVVQDTYGRPIGGVEIRSRGASVVLAMTNENGEFSYNAWPRTSTVLYLSKPGYRLTTLHLRASADRVAEESWSQVITMAATGETYKVDGYVFSQQGSSVRDAKAYLESRHIGTRYEATVENDGYYRFPAVEPGDDYQLRISATPDLRNISLSPLEVSGDTTLEYLMLEPLRTANLSILVRDATGYPVANQDLVVDVASNTSQRKRVTTNGAGMFTLQQIPEGKLNLSTRGYPKLEVSGIQFSAQYDTKIEVTLYVGDRTLRGRVVDATGSPVAGAVVEISGSERQGQATSRFTFRTSTNFVGDFEFSRLAQGRHSLRVRSAGYEQLVVDAGPEDTPMTLVLHEG